MNPLVTHCHPFSEGSHLTSCDISCRPPIPVPAWIKSHQLKGQVVLRDTCHQAPPEAGRCNQSTMISSILASLKPSRFQLRCRKHSGWKPFAMTSDLQAKHGHQICNANAITMGRHRDNIHSKQYSDKLLAAFLSYRF